MVVMSVCRRVDDWEDTKAVGLALRTDCEMVADLVDLMASLKDMM